LQPNFIPPACLKTITTTTKTLKKFKWFPRLMMPIDMWQKEKQRSVEQSCPIEHLELMEMLYTCTVSYNGFWPHVALEPLHSG